MSSALGASQAIQYLPAGSMVDYAGTSAPAGWLMCDGRSLPTSTYPELFSAIKYAYGGSGANFNLPDYRGRFARYNDNMGTGAASRDIGRVHGTPQDQATAKNGLTNSSSAISASSTASSSCAGGGNHTHVIYRGSDPISWNNGPGSISGLEITGSFSGPDNQTYIRTDSPGDHTHSISTSVSTTGTAAAQTISGDSETRPINLSCNRIIKY